MIARRTPLLLFLVILGRISRAEQIPTPTLDAKGCLMWSYDPSQPIPSDAKVVPGNCPTPDGRCYVVPSSACLQITGIDQALFDERPTRPPEPNAPPEGDPIPLPREPPGPPALRPTNPSGHVPLRLPDNRECRAGTGWDFENFLENNPASLNPFELVRGYASYDGWTGDGNKGVSPFTDLENRDVNWKAAPVYGNAIPIQRIRPAGWRSDIESRIGGDYWRFSQDINQAGDFWVGSLDRRYSWRQHPGETLDTWGEDAVGTLTSPDCQLNARYLSFRLGGSPHGSQRVEVHVDGASPRDYFGVRLWNGPGDPNFAGSMGFPTQFSSPNSPQAFLPPTGQDGWSVVRSAMPDGGLDSDWMQVFVFDLAPFVGRRIRIRIVDDHRDQCAMWAANRCWAKKPEHLQADDFQFLDFAPGKTDWFRHSDGLCGGVPTAGEHCSPIGLVHSEPPIWGFTDVHAHPMSNVTFGGHVFWGDAADSLDQVYDCSQPLPAIPGPGGRAAINPSNRRTTCYLSGEIVAIATGTLMAACSVLSYVPFVGPAAAAVCTVVVLAAAVTATHVPVLGGAAMHGASKPSDGAVKFGLLFSGLLGVLPDLALGFETGLLPQMDSFGPALGGEAGGWWKKGEDWHNPTGIGRTHNAYQADMIRRAFHGGMRLGVWDVTNARAFALVADGTIESDWQALKDGTDAAKRIVAARLNDIAAIAATPAEAERIIRSGRMAVILGSEVDELGRMRPRGLPWPRSPHSGSDSMQKQVDDLWELGIRKISPVHATNNPIGGAALFITKYNSNNFFISGTDPDVPMTFFDLPVVKIALDDTFGALLQDLILGQFSLIYDPIHPNQPSWNPTDWFDFDIRATRPDDDLIGEYERITYRMGSDGFRGPTLRNAANTGWLPASDVLGTQILHPKLLKGITFAVSGPTCNLYNTTLPDHVTSFGPIVDAHFVQANGHRNALGMHRVDGVNDGVGFLRAAMKKGMLLDTDHLSQNMRIDVYRLGDTYAQEAGWPRGVCVTADAPICGQYPFVGVHSKARGLEIDSKAFPEIRNAYGYSDEASRSEKEIRIGADRGHAFAVFPTGSAIIPPNTIRCTKPSDCANYSGPGSGVCKNGTCQGIVPTMVPRDFDLPVEVANDCDESSKTYATKYLWLMKTTRGRGLTPSTDMNGLITTLKPRYGNGLPWNSACGGADRDHNDQADVPGQPKWRPLMLAGQAHESSGVWYQDYAARAPTTSFVGTHWGDNRFKRVVARGTLDQREDRAPRAQVDDEVFYNDFGPDPPRHRGYTYQTGNRPGAQMYPMVRWQMLSGRRGWDFNLDGLQHVGLFPDLFQDMRNVGVQWEQFGPLVHSARDYIALWGRAVAIGAAHP